MDCTPPIWTPKRPRIVRARPEDVAQCAPPFMGSFSFGLAGRAGKVSGFDPATLSLTGWYRASYAGSPWTPTASAGSSGSNGNLTEATNAPATGSAVNGLTPADFDGTNDMLTGPANTTLYSTTAYSIIQLVYIDAFALADPGAGAPYNCPGGLGNHTGDGGPVGGFAGSGASGVWRWGHTDGGGWDSASASVSTGAWTMVAATFDNTNISASVNAGAPTTQAQGTVVGTAGFGLIGRNYLAAQFSDMKVLEIMTSNTDLSASLSNIKSYFNARYALSL